MVAVWGAPAVAALSPLRLSVAAGAGLMVSAWVALSELVLVSVAVTLWLPAFVSVTGNWCTPASAPVNV